MSEIERNVRIQNAINIIINRGRQLKLAAQENAFDLKGRAMLAVNEIFEQIHTLEAKFAEWRQVDESQTIKLLTSIAESLKVMAEKMDNNTLIVTASMEQPKSLPEVCIGCNCLEPTNEFEGEPTYPLDNLVCGWGLKPKDDDTCVMRNKPPGEGAVQCKNCLAVISEGSKWADFCDDKCLQQFAWKLGTIEKEKVISLQNKEDKGE